MGLQNNDLLQRAHMLEEVLLAGRSRFAASLGPPMSAHVEPSRSPPEASIDQSAENAEAERFLVRLPSTRKRLLRAELGQALCAIGAPHDFDEPVAGWDEATDI